MSFQSNVNANRKQFFLRKIQQKSLLLALIFGGYLTIAGCAGSTGSGETSGQNEGTESEINIVSTFTPITSFAKAVAGDRAKVTQLLPKSVSPHDYQARPDDMVTLQKANIVIENGLEFEPFLEAMIEASENQNLVVIDSSEGVPVVDFEESHEGHDDHEGEHDEHAHEEEEHDDHAHEGEEHDDHDKAEGKNEKTKGHEGHAHGEHDPHIWLDPKRAIQQVENIRDGLIKADPEGEEIYQANAQDYIEQLQALDKDITQQLQPYQGKTFVTYHDFAAYFAQSYGLEVDFLVGVPSENATPEDVTRVINVVKDSNLKTLLTEPQATNDPFSALAKDLDISVSLFDPMGTSASSEIEADSYINTMRNNLKNLSAAFSTQSQQSHWIQPSRNASRKTVAMLPY